MDEEEVIVEILEGNVHFSPSTYSFLGGSRIPESPHQVLLRTGNKAKAEELHARVKEGFVAGKLCWLKVAPHNLAFITGTQAIIEAGNPVFIRILASQAGSMEDEYGLERAILSLIVNLATFQVHVPHS